MKKEKELSKHLKELVKKNVEQGKTTYVKTVFQTYEDAIKLIDKCNPQTPIIF